MNDKQRRRIIKDNLGTEDLKKAREVIDSFSTDGSLEDKFKESRKLDPQVVEGVIDDFSDKLKQDDNFRRHMYTSVESAIDESPNTPWVKDAKEYLKSTHPSDFDVKELYKKVEDKASFFKDIKEKHSHYYGVNPEQRANSDIIRMYPEFSKYSIFKTDKQERRRILDNKLKQ